MAKKLVITVSSVDEDGLMQSSKEISKKEIIPPTDISNFGYNREEQLKILEDIQQTMLDRQADFLKSETE